MSTDDLDNLENPPLINSEVTEFTDFFQSTNIRWKK